MRKYIGDYDLYKGQTGFEQNPYVKFPLVELPELTEVVVRETANSNARTFIAVNVCNPDMVGHTGDMDACVKCVEAIDDSLQRMVEQALKSRGIAVITADHGNIEEIFSEGEPNTYHTRARVPFAILGMPARPLCADGTLKDVAPTVLSLLLGEEKAEVKKHLVGRILFK
jgi:2,3-bisphosphoglycerate-independent phosphoglycerate mutase